MQEWEHRHVIFSNGNMTDNGVAQLNAPDVNVFILSVGDEGWEMVSMALASSGDHHFAFKRPKQEESAGAGVSAAASGIVQGLRERVEKARDVVTERFGRAVIKKANANCPIAPSRPT